MGTKSAQIQTTEGAIGTLASLERSSTWAKWFSNLLLKRRVASRAISLFCDAVALVLAHGAAQAFVVHYLRISILNLSPKNYAFLYLPFLLGVLFLFERDQRPELRRPEKELELTVKGVSFAFVLLVCVNFVIFKDGFSRYMFLVWYSITLVVLLAARYGLRITYSWLWSREIGRRRTLLVGSEQKLFELQTLLSIQRYRGYELVGILPAGADSREKVEARGLPILGGLNEWEAAAQSCRAEQVIIALDERAPSAHELLLGLIRYCLSKGIDVQVYSDLFASRAFNYELDEFSGFFQFFAAPLWSKQAQLIAKHSLDLVAGLAGTLIAVGALPLVALAIKLDDGGPLFYRRELLGRGGVVRPCWKFRSMRTNAQEILDRDPALKAKFTEKHKLIDDPRVTRVGRILRKYSIDELPEFFLVLAGKLTLVGPRAITTAEACKYGDCLQKLTSVKPGMTGFWQVMGRQLTTYEERVRMDMFYIDHWSIWLDLWIFIKTFWKVLRAEGAY